MFAHSEKGGPIQVHRDGCNITITFADHVPMKVRREAKDIVTEQGRTSRVMFARGGNGMVVTCTLVRKGLKGTQVGQMYKYVAAQLQQDLDTYWVVAQRMSSLQAHPARGKGQ